MSTETTKPVVITPAKMFGITEFIDNDHAQAVAEEIRRSLEEYGCALLNFNGINVLSKECMRTAFKEFTRERNQCRILVAHTKAPNLENTANVVLGKLVLTLKSKE